MINLAVADMLAAVNATDNFVLFEARFCNLLEHALPVKIIVYYTILTVLFPVTSVTNMTDISLERLFRRLGIVWYKNGFMD